MDEQKTRKMVKDAIEEGKKQLALKKQQEQIQNLPQEGKILAK